MLHRPPSMDASTIRRRSTSLLSCNDSELSHLESPVNLGLPDFGGDMFPPPPNANYCSVEEADYGRAVATQASGVHVDYRNALSPEDCVVVPDLGFPAIRPLHREDAEHSWPPDPDTLSSPVTDKCSNAASAEDCQTPLSTCSDVSDGSINAKLPLLIGTAKFTDKWPGLTAMKYFNLQPNSKALDILPNGSPSPILEQGRGPHLPYVWKWTPSKIWLLFSVMTVFTYGAALLLWALMTWFDGWSHADAMVVADFDILVLITVSSTLVVFTSVIGIAGTFLNSRPMLAIYTLLLWSDLVTILAVGYTAYKRVTFNFDRKLNLAWSRFYTLRGKQMIQDSFNCCGFYNAMHEPFPTKSCFIRASIPGCRNALYKFELANLTTIWKLAFIIVGLHILNMVVSLLCSNHVTNRFGKGLTPKKYRLSAAEVKAESDRVGISVS